MSGEGGNCAPRHGNPFIPVLECFGGVCRNVGQSISAAQQNVNRILEQNKRGLVNGVERLGALPVVHGIGRFASVSSKAPRLTSDEYFEAKKYFDSLPKEEQEEIRARAMESYLDQKVQYKGRTMTRRKFKEKYGKERELAARGGNRNTYEEVEWDKERVKQLRESALQLPRDAYKLPLQKLAEGALNRGLWGKDFSFAIYAKPKEMKKLLEKKWSGSDPQKAVGDPNFFQDIVRNAHKIELTLVVRAERKLSVFDSQRKYKKLVLDELRKLNHTENDEKELDAFVDLFDPEYLRGVPWMSGSRVVPEAQINFAVMPDSKVKVGAGVANSLEQIMGGPVGKGSSPAVTSAMFNLFLGDSPIDNTAKEMLGMRAFHAANGVYDRLVKDHSHYMFGETEVTRKTFQLDGRSAGKFLLKGVANRRKRKEEAAIPEMAA